VDPRKTLVVPWLGLGTVAGLVKSSEERDKVRRAQAGEAPGGGEAWKRI
jgi:hypothetical protein